MILNEEEKVRARNCIANIKDKLVAIETELSKDKSYKGYLKEKTTSIFNDANCLDYLMNQDEEENQDEIF